MMTTVLDPVVNGLPNAPDLTDALDYLKTGGLGEVIGLADMARQMGQPVQMDTDMALALCKLAAEALATEGEGL